MSHHYYEMAAPYDGPTDEERTHERHKAEVAALKRRIAALRRVVRDVRSYAVTTEGIRNELRDALAADDRAARKARGRR